MFGAINSAAGKLGLNLNPEMVLMDFENAAIVAVLDTFPNAKPQGCYFHFTQNLYRNLSSNLQKECSSNVNFVRYIRSFFALAFLPEIAVKQAFSILKESFSVPAHLTADFNSFCDYMTRTYIGNIFVHPMYAIAFWNVHDRVVEDLPRTNNAVEGWNHKLNHVAGCHHPSFLRFLDIIRNEQESTAQSFEFRKTGNPPKRTKPKYRRINANIKELVTLYDLGKKEILEFLEGMSVNTHNFMSQKNKRKRSSINSTLCVSENESDQTTNC